MSSVQETSRSHANKPNTSVTGTSNSTKVNYVPYHKNRAANEKYKEQQAKLKEEKEAKRATLDERHYHLFQIVTNHLGLDYNEVEDAVIEGTQLDIVSKFFEENGSKHLIFCYSEDKPSSNTKDTKPSKGKLQIVDKFDLNLYGVCIFFLRHSSSSVLTIHNISQDTFFGFYDCKNESILSAISRQLNDIFLPALTKMAPKGWGQLAGKEGEEIKLDYLSKISKFVSTLNCCQESIDERVFLKPCEKYDLSQIQTTGDYLSVANSDSLAAIEETVKVWIKQIELVLAESEQVRRERDDIGPRAELEYWKKRTSKFNSLFDQIKEQNVKSALGVLQIAKSRLLIRWRNLDTKITESGNEARDNVKYLYTLEKFCDPLYNSDPVSMISDIPGLINAIRMIHSISRYYNTSERMTSLFYKVTNQMVNACKSYISCIGTQTIWSQPQATVIKKLKDSIRLNQEYQSCFQRTKEKLARMPDERPFDFSEMYIFGKFDSFTRRCQNIIDLFNKINTYTRLSEITIEGMEQLIIKFNSIVTLFKKKTYDFLDQRKTDFNNDYDEFKDSIQELHESIVLFMDTQFDKIHDTHRAIALIKRFEKLDLPNVSFNEKYIKLLTQYSKDIEHVSKIYQKFRLDPPIARDLPPTTGKILWSRQLYRRIEKPMTVFEANKTILQYPEAKQIVKNYNKISAVLFEYELLYHRAWLRHVDIVLSGLHTSLIIKDLETNEYLINFDPELIVLMRETECMKRLNLEVSKEADNLWTRQDVYKKNHGKIKNMLEKNKQVRNSIPKSFELLIVPQLQRLDQVLLPGQTNFTWVSPNIEEYHEKCIKAIENLELTLVRCNDLVTYRIEAVFQEMLKTKLCEFDEEEPSSIYDFLQTTDELCLRGSESLQVRSLNIKEAVEELIELVYPEINEELVEQDDEANVNEPEDGRAMSVYARSIKSAQDRPPPTPIQIANKKRRHEKNMLIEQSLELFNHYNYRNQETVIKLIKLTLEKIRKRIVQASNPTANYGHIRIVKETPIFKSNALLAIPSITLQPSLDDIQTNLNRATQMIINVGKGISQWSKIKKIMLKRSNTMSLKNRIKEEETEQHKPTTYLKAILENKEITKVSALIATCITSIKADVEHGKDTFFKYKFIWERNKESELGEFLANKPTVTEYEAKLKEFNNLSIEINSYPELIPVGPIALVTETLKDGLILEINIWKVYFGKSCNNQYRVQIENIINFIETCNKKLQRPIKDLDDIRETMAALKEFRENEISVDMNIPPIEESYSLLQKHEIDVPREETEKCDTLRYSWEKLKLLVTQKSHTLLEIQVKYKDELKNDVRNFIVSCDKFNLDYVNNGPGVAGIPPRDASDRLFLFQNNFDGLYRKYVTYNGGEELFGLPITEYPELLKIKKELALLQKLYTLYNNVIDTINGYHEISWSEVNVEKMFNELSELQNKCRRLPKALKDWQAFEELKVKIDGFHEICPLLEMMTNKAMKKRHWDRISAVTKMPIDMESGDDIKLKMIVEMDLLENREELEDICISAVKEKDIESKLKQVTAEWAYQEFQFSTFKNRGELLLKGDRVNEIMVQLEESLMVLSSLLTNRYNVPFKKQIQDLVKNLSETNEILENWMMVQNLWIYLEAVFVGGDIAKQLPAEAKRFNKIDKSWLKIMSKAHENTNVVNCCTIDETLKQLLPFLLEQLELCQKSLTGYLEKKRSVFPRFFFVSDPVLLEILGQASDCRKIENHLLSIFDNTRSLKFHDKEYDRILAIVSKEGEVINLEKPFKAEGNVENWLMKFLNLSKKAVHAVIRTAYLNITESESFNLIEFLDSFPAQIGLLGIQIIWTTDSAEAMTNARYDKKIMVNTNNNFLSMLNQLIQKTTTELTKVERTKYETLITIHVHQRDIFDDLVKLHVKSPMDFEWLKQTRFYFKEDEDKLNINITDVEFLYQNEFLGCTERLVITPLTDRCYITLAQAIHMSMGGAPAGPAGTGKTETTKDMGRCLGKYVVVFNCSDQMDFRILGRFFKGLAQSGSWGCFDEFNRIELPVLSVAAQQISIVLQCRKERKKQFIFTDGDMVDMNPEFGIFLTMNPGYAGRQELPENLKINFRTVAMMVPDRLPIIRVKLASAGFLENITLARKFYTLYKLCEEQLSNQVHYDFGLRNILSVLRTLGDFKRANPLESEQTVVMRVLRDMNLSKLIDEDEPLFKSLIDDLFPGLVLETAGYPELEAAIDNQIKSAGLTNHPSWSLKLIQLYETQLVRHGMMTLGPAGAGKTTCIHTLMKAMTDIGESHKEMRMNPKAITAQQMFGKLDVATNDWTDGIFSTLWRRTVKTKKNDHVWLVLDGPVDAIWIENLNSVLDDNKTLTLANGDRLPMAPNCKIIFEPHNIDNASPATVSRNGMVYMSSSGLDWSPIVQGWIKRERQAQEGQIIMELFEQSFSVINEFFNTTLTSKMDVLECMIVGQICKLLTGMLPSKDNKESLSKSYLERLYVFALMWSFGAFLELDDRKRLEEFFRDSEEFTLDLPIIPNDSEDTIFDYYVDEKTEWEHWDKRVEEYEYPTTHTPEYSSILVPNVDNIRTEYLIQLISKQNKAVLLIGEQGTAKTLIIKSFLDQFNQEENMQKTLNFSSATTPGSFQKIIESYVDKRLGTTYGPPAGKRMSVFIDDINMPVINEWNDQITNEIVRQLMENSGFYSLEKPGEFINIVDINFLAAMIQPGGGRNDIPQRLKRHFSIFNCTLPSNSSIDKIFSVIGTGHYCKERGFSDAVIGLVSRLVPVTRRLWQLTKIKMLPTPAKFHYVFNLRDLSRIWQGMINTLSSVVVDEKILMSLWKHECTRVIADRFASIEDVTWFEKTVKRVAEEDLGERLSEYCAQDSIFVDFLRFINENDLTWFKKTTNRLVDDEIGAEYLNYVANDEIFCSFLRDVPENLGEDADEADFEMPKVYEPVDGFEALEERLKMFLGNYNETVRGSRMDLVFFKDAMMHLIKISRIIRMPKGNALLVGVGGSGKQSLTKLASFIANYKIFQISLTRAYGPNNLLEDLKYLYRTAGQDGKGITFIFTDQDIKEEGFLEYINNVLSSGVVAGLFARDEMEEITNLLVAPMKKEYPKRIPTMETLYDYFLQRVRQNLHITLCFSPIGEKFRNRALKFPGLISGCTIDWFQRWPKEALISVADHFLADYKIVCSPEIKSNLVTTMGHLHHNVSDTCANYFAKFRRSTHVTPKSYLSFISGYKVIYKQKFDEINTLADRMNTGLEKLVEAASSVGLLKKELDVKEKELIIANEKADMVLKEVAVKKETAEVIKAQVQKVKDKAQIIVDDIEVDKGKAEIKLADAQPILHKAEKALKTIKASDINIVRALKKPPHLIRRIMDCSLILLQRPMNKVTPDPDQPCPTPSWDCSLKLMAGTDFLGTLNKFSEEKKDTITEESVELMEPYLRMADYNFEVADKVCGNVAGLLLWTEAMSKFFEVNKEILPLNDNLIRQNIRLKAANNDLNTAQAKLDEKENELNATMELYNAAMKEKDTLIHDAEVCRTKMETASALINGLADERARWTEQSKEFRAQITRLVGDAVICTGFLSYQGPFNQDFRTIIGKEWQKLLMKRRIPYSPSINVVEYLTDSAKMGVWSTQGLPTDDLSIQNAIIVTKAARYPLLIDPQGQGKAWIKNLEGSNELQITTLGHKYFRQHFEDALSLGRPLLIEDIAEEIDPALDNTLEKNFIKSGSILKVKVGDKEVDVMKGFKLYITTKLGNPLFTPETSAKTSIIDFTVTLKGLEDQLLGRVINTEKRELELERVKLLDDVLLNKQKMKDLEDNLLFRLTTTKGSLVDDPHIVEVLNITKTTSIDVRQKLQIAADTSEKINIAREEFRPVATRGSIMYFLIVEMSMVNVMYQTALKQFLQLFDMSMENSMRSPITSKRITNIIDFMTYEVFKYMVRGFYEEHKFMFTLLLALKIDMQSGKVRHDEFQTLIKGGASLDINNVQAKPCKWIMDSTWLNLVELSKLFQFSAILEQIPRNDKQWRAWFDKETPENETIPDGYHNSLDMFRKLLLIRSWCPDRTLPQAKKYIGDSIGDKYVDGFILDLDKMVEESEPLTPLICFLSMGSDPSPSIESNGKKKGLEVKSISMGQGQEIHARRLVSAAITSGNWVLLQNCHLSLDFCNEILDTLNMTEEAHENFRIWITTEPTSKFPISLLQMSIKFTAEPPQGIRAGLKRTFQALSADFLEISNSAQWKPLLYATTFLHSILQERRKYGPLGWNIPYEFNQSDFNATIQFVQNHLDEMDPKRGICWKTVRYMIGECQYGGRVTDDCDKTLLKTFTSKWFGEQMFSNNFIFSEKCYNIPKYNKMEDVLNFISLLPQSDKPEAFGLHGNANITYQTNTAKLCLDTILSIQPKESSGSIGETRESVVQRIAHDMLEKLPPDYIPHEVKAKLLKSDKVTPMNIFLRQEIDRMQKVISVVRRTLIDLKLAIDGTIIMNEELRDALDNIYDAKIPNSWQKISWESSTLGFWFTELIERNNQFRYWCFEARPLCFWMTGFFNAQGFLTAMRQEVTRMNKDKGWSLDTVMLMNEVTTKMKDEITTPPLHGVYIYGLFLEGASWSKSHGRLIESKPKILFEVMPVMHISALCNPETGTQIVKSGLMSYDYLCPIYKKPKRTDLTFIATVNLRSGIPPEAWVLKGTCLLCDTK